MVGHKVSHSNIKTKRRFLPNLCNVTFISDALGRNVRLRVSTNAIKSVDHRGGFDAFMLKAKADRAVAERAGPEARDREEDRQGGPGREGELSTADQRLRVLNGRVERPGRFVFGIGAIHPGRISTAFCRSKTCRPFLNPISTSGNSAIAPRPLAVSSTMMSAGLPGAMP